MYNKLVLIFLKNDQRKTGNCGKTENTVQKVEKDYTWFMFRGKFISATLKTT